MDNQLMNYLTTQGLEVPQFILTLLVLAFILFRRGEIKNLRKELLGEIDKLRTELLWKIDNLRTEQKADLKELRAELKADIRSIKENDLQHINNDILNLRKEFDYLRKDMEAKLELLCKDMETNNAEHRKDFELLRTQIDAKLELLRKALLLLANQSIDNPERLERLKDLLTI
ncbi:MAG: hypothetical protein MdMp024_0596 [Bacteroidales bacterium]